MNSFCKFCTANDRQEIVQCEFKSCPFWRERWADMDWQIEKIRINNLKKSIKECKKKYNKFKKLKTSLMEKLI